MDAIGAMIVFIIGMVCIAISVIFISNDYRHFDQVVKQCTDRGYIQNNNVRIMCKPESKE